MPSLKDLRNRIASVKATQKITKAMQMVAAAKLRRAQMAAEAARPYAERMEKVLASLASGISGSAPGRCCSRHRQDATRILLVVCHRRARPVRRLQFLHRPSRARQGLALQAQGKTVKILCVGKKGYDQLRRQFAKQIIDLVELRGVRQIGFGDADPIGKQDHRLVRGGRVRRRDPVLLGFRSVIAQIPTALQLIPAEFRAAGEAMRTAAYEIRARARTRSSPPCCRAISRCRCSARLLENAASEQGARMSAMDNATRNAGEMIKKQTMIYNRSRQAMITKELIEIISGAEAL